MRIAVLAHVRHPIRPPFMGGMEAHAYHLARELQRRGHDVTLFAAGDSDAGVPLRPVMRAHYEQRYPWHEYHGTDELNDYLDGAFAKTCAELLAGDFDVVHNNTLHRYLPRLSRVYRVPMVTSLHVPAFEWLRRAVEESAAPWTRFTATTRQHARSYWAAALPAEAHVVHNGIDPAAWAYGERGDGSVVWAGRIAPNKGTHLAVAAARRAGLPMTLYGPVEREDYFAAEVAPLLTPAIQYGGHVSAARLSAALRRASVFAFTPMWDEPFGLAAVEAMACGLPVAAFDRGAVREVIGERAGRYAAGGDVVGLAAAMRRCLAIDRAEPRRRVEGHYSITRMVDGYEAVYERAVAGLGSEAADVEFPEWELRVGAPPARASLDHVAELPRALLHGVE